LRKLVEQDERLAAFEHRVEVGRARCGRGRRIFADCLVERLAADLERDFPPQGVGDEFRPLRAMNRQLVAGDPGDAAFAGGGKRRSVDQRRADLGELPASEREMGQRDQRVGLAAAERRLEPIDGGRRIVPGEAQQRLAQHELDPVRRGRPVAKELVGVGIEIVDLPTAPAVMRDHLRQARGKNLRVEGPLENTVARPAAFDDAAQCLPSGVAQL
jgi:hypothetical protein